MLPAGGQAARISRAQTQRVPQREDPTAVARRVDVDDVAFQGVRQRPGRQEGDAEAQTAGAAAESQQEPVALHHGPARPERRQPGGETEQLPARVARHEDRPGREQRHKAGALRHQSGAAGAAGVAGGDLAQSEGGGAPRVPGHRPDGARRSEEEALPQEQGPVPSRRREGRRQGEQRGRRHTEGDGGAEGVAEDVVADQGGECDRLACLRDRFQQELLTEGGGGLAAEHVEQQQRAAGGVHEGGFLQWVSGRVPEAAARGC